MDSVARMIRSYPLTAYIVLAYFFSIVLGLGLFVSLMFGLLALFGPAAAAFIVEGVSRGRPGVRELWATATRWRVHPGWYLAAVALPIVGTAIGQLLFVLAGNAPLAVPGKVEPILLVLFFLVIGEEIGWRGFLLRRLLTRTSPLVATLIVGVVWLLWHSPLYFIPGMPSYGNSFAAFAIWVLPFSFLMTWLWLGTRSAWLATIMHGTANLAGSLVFPTADAATLFIFSGIGFALLAVPLVAASWPRWMATHTEPADGLLVPAPAT
jgi:uncharacterized protein